MSSSPWHVELTLCAIPSPFPHSLFCRAPLNFYFSSTVRSINFQTRPALSSSSPNPCLHRPVQIPPLLLNVPALLSPRLDRFLSSTTDFDPQCRASLAEVIGQFISELQPPLHQVDAHIQVVRYEFVNPMPAFRIIDGAYVIDAADIGCEKGSILAVKDFIQKRSYECRDGRDEDGSICFESYRKALKTDCNHVFHLSCISKWLLKNNTCPLCRKSLH